MKSSPGTLALAALLVPLVIGAPASGRCVYVDVNGDGVTVYAVPAGPPREATTANGAAANGLPGSEPPVSQPPGNTPLLTYSANAYVTDENRLIRLYSHGPSWSAEMEAVSGFQVKDIVPSSITASYGGTQVHAIGVRNVVRQTSRDAPRIAGVFWKGDLVALFAGLPDGRQTADVQISGNVGQRGAFQATVSVVVEKETQPLSGKGYVQASPNPFNPSTTIAFDLARAGRVRVRVYDVSGRLVNTLADQDMAAGRQEVRWDATRRDRSRVPSGVYFYVIETPECALKNSIVVAK